MLATIKNLAKKSDRIRFAYHNTLYICDAVKFAPKRLKYPVLPPARLMYLVAGSPNSEKFVKDGSTWLDYILLTLERNNVDYQRFMDVLDFGVGCGRIARHVAARLKVNLYGTDYNPKMVRWCQNNLVGKYSLNKLLPPLEYFSGSFDFVYAWSVFTHLNEEYSFMWLDELYRVLKPSGYLWFSFSGEKYLPILSEANQKIFLADKAVLYDGDKQGTNWCCSYFSQQYARSLVAKSPFELVDVGTIGEGQSYCLLRKGSNLC